MPTRLVHLVVDAADPAGLARFWSAALVARLEGLGARQIDIGQPDDVSWVVMADPEGNEFCVLTPR
jgi:hypothetical protein